MAVVYLIRHGQASFGAADYDVLSELGARQAELTGTELARRGVRPGVVRSGAMLRQRDSAKACLEAAGIDVAADVDGRFDEYDHVDLLAGYDADRGLDRDALDHALRRWVADEQDAPCAETWPAFRDRARAGLDSVIEECGSGGSAVVFTSGGVISALCAPLLGAGPATFLAMNSVTANAGITKIVHGRSGTSLLSFNDHAHFDGEHAGLLTYR